MRAIVFLLSLLPGAVLAATPEPTGMANAVAHIDALTAYAGRWRGDIRFLSTAYGKARENRIDLRNDCWRSAAFYVCNQFVNGKSQALLVYRYDSGNGYISYPILADGSAVKPGHLFIEGNVWTFPWQVEKDGKTTYFRVTNTWASHDHIDFRQEYSADGKQWTPMAEGQEDRVKE